MYNIDTLRTNTMNKKKLLTLISSLLLIGGTISFTNIFSKQEAKGVKADYSHTTLSGLYKKVEDASEVTPGTKVIITTTRGWVFEGIGGNPAYAHASGGSVTMFGDYDSSTDYCGQDETRFLMLNNKAAIELTVEQGASGYSSSYLSFKADFYIGGTKYSDYLGENDEEQDPGRNDYKSIGWFMDGFGCRPTKDGKSTWELEYDTSIKCMKMRKVYYDDDTSFLCYEHSGARNRFNFGGINRVNINLYIKVEDENFTRSLTPNPISDPDKTVYAKGETMDFEGLEVGFIVNGVEYVLKYDWRTSCFFSTPPVVTNNTNVVVQAFGFNYIIGITITSNASNNRYNLQSSLPPDVRGTYLLSTENSRVFNASQSTGTTNNYTSLDNSIFVDGYITADDEKLDASVVRIVRTNIGGTWYYHAMNYLGKYISIGSEKPHDERDEYYVDYSDDATTSNAVTITNDSLKIGDYYLTEEEGSMRLICFTKSYVAMHFFKLDTTASAVSSQVSDFVQFFIDRTHICQDLDGGDFEKITDELWNDIKTEFNKLGCDAQGLFASATYTHNGEEEYSKANVADRYDYIVSKYDKEDFMLRKLSNTYVNSFSNNSLSPLLTVDNSGTTIILVVITISASTFAAVLFIRNKKRKQINN